MLNITFVPLILELKEMDLCTSLYSRSELLLIDALPHNITKRLDDGLSPKKEAAIKKPLINYSYLSKISQSTT